MRSTWPKQDVYRRMSGKMDFPQFVSSDRDMQAGQESMLGSGSGAPRAEEHTKHDGQPRRQKSPEEKKREMIEEHDKKEYQRQSAFWDSVWKKGKQTLRQDRGTGNYEKAKAGLNHELRGFSTSNLDHIRGNITTGLGAAAQAYPFLENSYRHVIEHARELWGLGVAFDRSVASFKSVRRSCWVVEEVGIANWAIAQNYLNLAESQIKRFKDLQEALGSAKERDGEALGKLKKEGSSSAQSLGAGLMRVNESIAFLESSVVQSAIANLGDTKEARFVRMAYELSREKLDLIKKDFWRFTSQETMILAQLQYSGAQRDIAKFLESVPEIRRSGTRPPNWLGPYIDTELREYFLQIGPLESNPIEKLRKIADTGLARSLVEMGIEPTKAAKISDQLIERMTPLYRNAYFERATLQNYFEEVQNKKLSPIAYGVLEITANAGLKVTLRSRHDETLVFISGPRSHRILESLHFIRDFARAQFNDTNSATRAGVVLSFPRSKVAVENVESMAAKFARNSKCGEIFYGNGWGVNFGAPAWESFVFEGKPMTVKAVIGAEMGPEPKGKLTERFDRTTCANFKKAPFGRVKDHVALHLNISQVADDHPDLF